MSAWVSPQTNHLTIRKDGEIQDVGSYSGKVLTQDDMALVTLSEICEKLDRIIELLEEK